jgi:hypothetical protein
MTEEQLRTLMDWIDAKIDVKIEDALHRDSLTESIVESHCRDALHRAFGIDWSR